MDLRRFDISIGYEADGPYTYRYYNDTGTYIDAEAALARIADLEAQLQAAQQWQPVVDGECNLNVTEMITVSGKGKWLRCEDLVDNLEVGVTLPDNIRLCRKVQP